MSCFAVRQRQFLFSAISPLDNAQQQRCKECPSFATIFSPSPSPHVLLLLLVWMARSVCIHWGMVYMRVSSMYQVCCDCWLLRCLLLELRPTN